MTATGGRPTRRVAIAVLVVALIAGAIVGVIAVTLGRPDASGTSGASVGSGNATAAPTDTAAQQVAAVRDYYATVTGNSGAGWARLGPELQGAAGGFSGYQSFWSTIASTRVQDAEAVDDDTVRATVQFVPRNRSATDEVHDLGMVRGTGGTWLIDSDRLVPAGER